MIKKILYKFYSWKRDKYFYAWLKDGEQTTFDKYDKYVNKTFKIYGHG